MKKFFPLLIFCFFATVVTHAQQTIKSEKLDPFTQVELTGNLIVEMTEAKVPTVEIKLNNTDIKNLVWGVANGKLSIRLKPGARQANSNAEIKISYTSLSSLSISGANVAIVTPCRAKMLDIDMNAGSTFGAEMKVKDVAMKVAGNSAVNITGEVQYFTLTANGRSKVNAREMKCVDANISAASNAEVYVYGTDRLQLLSDSGASIFYRGEPEIFRSNARMMGTINTIGK